MMCMVMKRYLMCFWQALKGQIRHSERLAHLRDRFTEVLKLASADFQSEYGYEIDAPGTANMTVATNWVAEHF